MLCLFFLTNCYLIDIKLVAKNTKMKQLFFKDLKHFNILILISFRRFLKDIKMTKLIHSICFVLNLKFALQINININKLNGICNNLNVF